MTTFTLRASEEIIARLTSAEMRSWLYDFICHPHALPQDPGSGYGRISLTLPADAVNAVAAYSKFGVSSALRRIAAERLGVEPPSGLHNSADHLTRAIRSSSRSHDSSQSRNEIAAALIHLLAWGMSVGISVVLLAHKRKNAEMQQDDMTQKKSPN